MGPMAVFGNIKKLPDTPVIFHLFCTNLLIYDRGLELGPDVQGGSPDDVWLRG